MSRTTSLEEREEWIHRGEEIFQREIRSKVEGEDPMSCLLIDIESGDYEVDADEVAASARLRARRPDAIIYFRLVGSRISRRFGGSSFKRGGSK